MLKTRIFGGQLERFFVIAQQTTLQQTGDFVVDGRDEFLLSVIEVRKCLMI